MRWHGFEHAENARKGRCAACETRSDQARPPTCMNSMLSSGRPLTRRLTSTCCCWTDRYRTLGQGYTLSWFSCRTVSVQELPSAILSVMKGTRGIDTVHYWVCDAGSVARPCYTCVNIVCATGWIEACKGMATTHACTQRGGVVLPPHRTLSILSLLNASCRTL